MKKIFPKLVTVIVGLTLGAAVYFSLWSIFSYFGIVN